MWQKNLDTKPVAWPNWDAKKFKNQVQDFFMDFLQTAYSPDDCTKAQLPDSGGIRSLIKDSGVYSFDDELEGLNECLDNVSDSSSDDNDTSDVERHPDPMASPPRKHQCVSRKGSKAAKGGKKGTTNGKDLNKENMVGGDGRADGGAGSACEQPKGPGLSEYKCQREANIAAIANHPLMKEINDDLKHICTERTKSKPKPKPHAKKSASMLSGPSQTSERLANISSSTNVAEGGVTDRVEDNDGRLVGNGTHAPNDIKEVAKADERAEETLAANITGNIPDGDDIVMEELGPNDMAVDDAATVSHSLNSSSLSGSADIAIHVPSTPLSSGSLNPNETLPAAALDWFCTAYTAFAMQSPGAEFHQLLQKYMLLEEKKGFDSPCIGLALRGRPQLLTKWVGRGRMQGAMPVLSTDSIDDYDKEWWSW